MVYRSNVRAMLTAIVLAGLTVGIAQARNDILHLSINDALQKPEAKTKLETDIKFYFGTQKAPKPTKSFGVFTSNKKTNFANKSDKDGCDYAFLSAMLSLRDRARTEGGNAVINITSYYKKNTFTSETEFECGAGAIVGGVALQGEVVKL